MNTKLNKIVNDELGKHQFNQRWQFSVDWRFIQHDIPMEEAHEIIGQLPDGWVLCQMMCVKDAEVVLCFENKNFEQSVTAKGEAISLKKNKDNILEEKFREFSRFGKGENAMQDVKRSDFNIKNPSISITFSGHITGRMIDEIVERVNVFIYRNHFKPFNTDWMEIWPVHICEELETEVIINFPLLEVIPSEVTKFFEENNIIWGEDAKGYLVFPSEILTSELTGIEFSCSEVNRAIHPYGNIVVDKVEAVSEGTCVWFVYSDGHGKPMGHYVERLTDYIRLKKEDVKHLLNKFWNRADGACPILPSMQEKEETDFSYWVEKEVIK